MVVLRTMISYNISENAIKILFSHEMDFLSWAIIGGGVGTGKQVYFRRINNNELPIHLDPKEVLKSKMEADGFENGVGFLTSAVLKNVTHVKKRKNNLEAEILTTVGMGNSLRVGDPAKNSIRVGTINILLAVNQPLSLNARLEAMNLISEARTLAVMEENIKSKKTNLPATGTGTDCTALASIKKSSTLSLRSTGSVGEELIYAGKHTVLGELIGATTHEAVRLGIQKWKREKERDAQDNSYCWGS